MAASRPADKQEHEAYAGFEHVVTNGMDPWDLAEDEQVQYLHALRRIGIPEGRRNELFIRPGLVFLAIKHFPDDWQDIALEILEAGVTRHQKKRERRRWWMNRAVPFYEKAIEEGRLWLGTSRFRPTDRYRKSAETGDEIERLLDGRIVSDRVLLLLIDLSLHMLDLQAEAERHGQRTFFRSLSSLAKDLDDVFPNVQAISRILPFVVAGFRFDRNSGEDLCKVPIFRCVAKASGWEAGQPKPELATEYQLSDEYRYLLDCVRDPGGETECPAHAT